MKPTKPKFKQNCYILKLKIYFILACDYFVYNKHKNYLKFHQIEDTNIYSNRKILKIRPY